MWNFADKSVPLTRLLKKGVEFKWGEEEKQAFQALKESIAVGIQIQANAKGKTPGKGRSTSQHSPFKGGHVWHYPTKGVLGYMSEHRGEHIEMPEILGLIGTLLCLNKFETYSHTIQPDMLKHWIINYYHPLGYSTGHVDDSRYENILALAMGLHGHAQVTFKSYTPSRSSSGKGTMKDRQVLHSIIHRSGDATLLEKESNP